MCRNITPLRGLDPPATAEEVRSAAIQYVRKVAAATPAQMASPAFLQAVDRVVVATSDLLAELPPRQRPPKVLPPLRRRSPASQGSG